LLFKTLLKLFKTFLKTIFWGNMKDSLQKKNSCKEKCLEKISREQQQSANSLEKKIIAEIKCIKKILP
jgi:hypothetical protein